MRGVNIHFILGNLGNDPEVKYTQGGMAITSMSVATTSVRKDKDGNAVEKTEWHRVKAFGKLGELCGEYLSKGSPVFIQGRVEYSTSGEGDSKKYFTDVVAQEVQFIGGGGGEGGGQGRQASSSRGGGGRAAAPRETSERQASSRGAPQDGYGAGFGGGDFADDDIPY